MGSRRGTVLDVVAVALAVLLVWLPLPFGGVRPWAHDVLRVAGFVLCGVAIAAARDNDALKRVALPAAAVAGIGLIGLFQALRWPLSWLDRVAPQHAELARTVAVAGTTAPASLAPAMSRFSALTWLAVAACLLTAAVVGGRSHRRRFLLAGLMLSAALQVVYGARQWIARSGDIWGVEVGKVAHRLRGTFVNADHLAVYLEICLAVILAWVWWALRRAQREEALERRFGLVAAPVIAWLTVFAAIAFTGSRAGLLAAAAATVVQGSVLAIGGRGWRSGLAAVLAPVVGVAVVATIGLQAGLGRWLGTSQYELSWNGRLAAYHATHELWSRFPVTGTGLGSFREAFPLVQPASLGSLWIHAHNDWLELLATTGLVGALFAAFGVVAVVVQLGAVVGRDRRTEVRAVGVAAVGAIAAVALHSCFDFGLTMPANAATLAIVTGAAIGANRRSRQYDRGAAAAAAGSRIGTPAAPPATATSYDVTTRLNT